MHRRACCWRWSRSAARRSGGSGRRGRGQARRGVGQRARSSRGSARAAAAGGGAVAAAGVAGLHGDVSAGGTRATGDGGRRRAGRRGRSGGGQRRAVDSGQRQWAVGTGGPRAAYLGRGVAGSATGLPAASRRHRLAESHRAGHWRRGPAGGRRGREGLIAVAGPVDPRTGESAGKTSAWAPTTRSRLHRCRQTRPGAAGC